MKKIINSPNNVVGEMLEGFVSAHCRYIEKVPDANGVTRREKAKGKVALVIGGGSGHEPLFIGFVGQGLADASVAGNIFASPNPEAIYNVTNQLDTSGGVIFLYGNYAGDNMNFDMAEEMLGDDGVRTAHIRVCDDCASAPPERAEERRGIAGDLFMIKVVGAACEAGCDFDEVMRIGEKALSNLRTVGLATSPGSIPGNPKPMFELGEDEIEFGMGIHGEPGIRRDKFRPADELAETMYSLISKDMALKKGDQAAVLINGLGSTTMLEMSIVYRKLAELLEEDGIDVYDGDIGNYSTSQEMGGFSISILRLDGELKKYYSAPCISPAYTREDRRNG